MEVEGAMDDDQGGSSSVDNINDKLVSLEVLLCKGCKQIPFGIVLSCGDGQGVVCEPCYSVNTDEYPGAVPNRPLLEILKLMKYPCANTKNGCREHINYVDVQNHKLTCKYRSYSCPMRILHDCQWSGHSSHLAEHFEVNHGDHVYNHDLYDSVVISINLENPSDTVYMILSNGNYFLMHIRCNPTENKLYHEVYYVNDTEYSSNCVYSIEPSAKTNYFLKIEEVCASFACFNADLSSLSDDSAVDLTVIKQIVQNLSNSIDMKVVIKNTQSEQLDEKMLSFFECPVCNHYMKPPIFQCLSGHSLCSRCRPKLGHCPTCRASFGSTRNYALESMTNGVRYPCTYRDLGCRKIFTVNEITRHESECTLRPYNCPFNDLNRCHWEGTHQTLIVHLKASHNEKIKYTDFYQTTVGFSFDQQYYDMFCMVTLGEVFRVCHRRDIGNQNGYWAVQLIGPRGEAKKYKYEVGLIDVRNNYRKMIRIDLCQDLTNQDNMFNQCILIPITIISWFSSNSQITYYVKISKLN